MTPALKRYAPLLALSFVVGFAVAWFFGEGHWIAWYTGSYNTSGVAHNYNFWSGFGSDLGEATLLSVLVTFGAAWYHKHNCHTENCWRIGLHSIVGGAYTVCRRCHNKITGHPQKKFSIDHLAAKHREHVLRGGA
jgi:hypothetical protein